MEGGEGVRVLRATFERVLTCQEELRKKIDELANDKRPLRKADELDKFMELLARSTLGLGTNSNIRIDGGNGVRVIKSVERFARWLAYQEGSEVDVGDVSPIKIGIGSAWEHLRDGLFDVFPIALERAASLSAERVPWSRQEPDDV